VKRNDNNNLNYLNEELERRVIEIDQLTKLLKSYEVQNLKKSELEKKIRSLNNKYEKDIKKVETHYKEV